MKLLVTNSFIVSLTIFSASFSLAMPKRVLPMAPPDITCTSADKNWSLLVNVDLGMIRVIDNSQEALSHTITDLTGQSQNGVVTLENKRGSHDLPAGIVFQANLKKSGINSYSVNDTKGAKTNYSCTPYKK